MVYVVDPSAVHKITEKYTVTPHKNESLSLAVYQGADTASENFEYNKLN